MGGAGEGRRLRWFAKRLGAGDLALLTRQLATLVASALPLDECLQAVADQSRKPAIKSMMLQVRSKVAEGHTLAHALNQFPQAFGEMYRAMVNAGEEAGQLAPVLEQLAHYTETRQHTAQKLQMALIYPFVLIAVAVAVVSALMIFVVPELVGIFAHPKGAAAIDGGVDLGQRLYARLCAVLPGVAGRERDVVSTPAATSPSTQALAPASASRSGSARGTGCAGQRTLRLDAQHSHGLGRTLDPRFAHCRCCDDEFGAP